MKNNEWKKFLLVLFKILWLFARTMTAKDKYSILNRDNEMQELSKD